VPAAAFQKLIASTAGGQTMQLQAAQTNAWPDGSLRFATLHGNRRRRLSKESEP
jgi:hypothetical protein